jgi:diguanylate cyclase (GGDEF)-like protein
MPGKQRRQEKGRAESHAALLHGLPLALIGVSGLDDVLRLTARYVMDALEYQDCVIYLRTADGRFEQRAAWGPKSPDGIEIINALYLENGEGIVGWAALTQETQLVRDTTADDRYVPDVGTRGSELAVPIVYAGETLGVIDSEHGDKDFYSSGDAEVVSAIAAIVAGMIRSTMSTEALNRTISELHQAQLELELASETDLLTGVGNRRRLEGVFDEASARGERFGVAVVDIDGLKRVNDHHGNDQGDILLRSVADTLARHCSTEGLTLARCESDEFVIIASPLPKGFAVRIAAALEDVRLLRVPSVDAGMETTASAGVAYGMDLSAWTDANDALTLAKHSGGDNLWIFRPDDPGIIRLRSDRAWAKHIERAVRENTLRLAAQAVSTAATNETVFYEVLLRWQEHDGSWGPPTELLAAAERLGLEQVIDRWVTRNVISALQTSEPELHLAMNWSVGSITSASMVRMLIDSLSESDVDPARLIVEVTEHGCIESPQAFREAVDHLRDAGVRVALDDLGSGWSSLRTLQSTPVDFIKLDGQWVCGARRDELALIAIRSMIECAMALDTLVIAEWVEDEPTRELVTGLGVNFLQGWLVHRPQPLDELLRPETASLPEFVRSL